MATIIIAVDGNDDDACMIFAANISRMDGKDV
jgi:hypothetical protein